MNNIFYCTKCGYKADYSQPPKFCPECGTPITSTSGQEFYSNIYGRWHVTTEGDCEGRSVRDLGTHIGFVDDIAFSLAGLNYYTLQFKKLPDVQTPNVSKHQEVHISFGVDSDTWDLKNDERVKYFQKILKDRPVEVRPSCYYAGIVLKKDK